MRFLVLTALLSACGTHPLWTESGSQPRQKVVELNEFKEFVDMFVDDAYKYGDGVVIDDLIIKFEDVPDNPDVDGVVLGVCYKGSNMTPTIHIDPEHWESRSYVNHIILMYHELGHCILNRRHTNSDSIMTPFIISPIAFVYFKDFYLNELFNYDSTMDLHSEHGDSCVN